MPIGIHISKTVRIGGKTKTRTMINAIKQDVELLRGYNLDPCIQIFVTGPQNYNETITDAEKEQIRAYLSREKVPCVIHGAYVDHPWNNTPMSVVNIKNELRTAHKIGATGVIVHLGAGAATDNLSCIEQITDLPAEICESVTLWLEIHTAKPSAATYETPAKLQVLFNRVAALNTHGMKVGLCIDTAHLFACGMSLDSDTAADEWLRGLPDVPVMLHLNDSASKLASGVDKHEVLLQGGIWKAYHPDTGHLPLEDSGLTAILNWAEYNGVVTILERGYEHVIADLTMVSQMSYFSV